MSLFERIKNKRYDLQEKRKFPGDESGAYKQAKDDLEARKGFKKNKPGGLKADEKNPFVKRSVRKARVDKLGGDIYNTPKFSQKQFEKSLKAAGGIKGITAGKKGEIPDPFGKGDTPGQIRVKGLETKAFKKTKPSDIKLPKSFTDFQKNLQDYKDKDKATMRTGKSSSKVKVTGANNLTRQDVGMAPPDKPKVIKQSEVSKKAKDFTNQIAQQKKVKTDKVVDLATKKQQSKLSQAAKDITQQRDDAIVKREKLRSVKGVKDTKAIRATNRQVKEFDKLAQTTKKAASGVGNPNAPVKYNKMTAGADFIKKNRSIAKPKTNTGLKNPPGMIDRRQYKGPVKSTNVELPKFANVSAKSYKKTKGPQLATDIQVRNVPREIRFAKTSQKVLAKTPKAIKPIARPALKLLAKAGTPGRIAAAGLGVAAISPAGRKALGQLATGAGLTALFGRGKKEKQLKVGDGLKNVGKVRVTADSRGLKRNQADMAKIKATQKNFIDKYNKGRTFGKIKYNVNKQGTYDVIKPKKK